MGDVHGAGLRESICEFVRDLRNELKLKGGDPREYYVKGSRLKRTRGRVPGGVNIYLTDAARLLGLERCEPAKIPSTMNVRDVMMNSEPVEEDICSTYRSAVGSLLLYVQDVPDAQLEVSMLGQYLKGPMQGAFVALKRLVRYLMATKSRYIALRLPVERRSAREGGYMHLQAYSDTDAAGDSRTRRSQSSVKIFADGVPMHSHSRLQKPVSTSSGTSEFYGLSSAAEKLTGFHGIFESLGCVHGRCGAPDRQQCREGHGSPGGGWCCQAHRDPLALGTGPREAEDLAHHEVRQQDQCRRPGDQTPGREGHHALPPGLWSTSSWGGRRRGPDRSGARSERPGRSQWTASPCCQPGECA